MKALSVKQPYATLICAGVKDIENRAWSTDYRGRVLIHASTWTISLDDPALPLPLIQDYQEWLDPKTGDENYESEYLYLDGSVISLRESAEHFRPQYELLKTEIAERIDNDRTIFPEHAIVGMATIADIVQNSDSPWSEGGCYHWILTDTVLFAEPILDVKGKLKLWEFDTTLIGDVLPGAKQMVRR